MCWVPWHILKCCNSVGLLDNEDLNELQKELKDIYKEIDAGNFSLEEDVEDIHSQIEFLLTKKLGDSGKKIHCCPLKK